MYRNKDRPNGQPFLNPLKEKKERERKKKERKKKRDRGMTIRNISISLFPIHSFLTTIYRDVGHSVNEKFVTGSTHV
jgi:hypothetical protein